MKATYMLFNTVIFYLFTSVFNLSFAYSVITNSDFESGSLLPWYQWIDGGTYDGIEEDWNVTTSDSHTGSFSATVVGNKGLRQDFTPAPTENINTISFWMKHPNLTSPVAASGVDFFYSDGTKSTVFISAPGTTEWEFYDVTADLLLEKQLVSFSVTGYKSTDAAIDRAYFDSVTINAVPLPHPSGYSALACWGWQG